MALLLCLSVLPGMALAAEGENVPTTATCTESGIVGHFTCANGGKHNYLATGCGLVSALLKTAYYQEGLLGHQYADAYTADENGHYHACLRPGCDSRTEAVAHRADAWEQTATAGHWKTCVDCGVKFAAGAHHAGRACEVIQRPALDQAKI